MENFLKQSLFFLFFLFAVSAWKMSSAMSDTVGESVQSVLPKKIFLPQWNISSIAAMLASLNVYVTILFSALTVSNFFQTL